jgi:hypothetical protein
MKITLQSQGNTYTIETKHDDMNISTMAELLRGLLVQCGFHPATVESAFNPEIFEYGSWDLEVCEPHIDDSQYDQEIIDTITKKGL